MLRLLAYGLTAGVLMCVVIVVSAYWYARSQKVPQAEAILVLGAGMDPDGSLHGSSRDRVIRAVELWNAGAAPLIVMTGGAAVTGGPSAGGQMAKLARAAGVPHDAIIVESRAQSTLQNALFSQPILVERGISEVILVTEGFHMARSIASCRWAGIHVVGARTSTALRPDPRSAARMVVREAGAWGFNLARVAGWHVTGWLGMPDDRRIRFLAHTPIMAGHDHA